MVKYKSVLFIFIVIIAIVCQSCDSNLQTSPESTPVAANTPITPKAYQAMLGRGFDVDWWERNDLDPYGDYTDLAVKHFKERGVGHIRIRIHHYNLTDADFKRLRHQVMTCIDQDIVPIVAFSAKPYKENPCVEEHDLVVDWWRQMSLQMADIPHKLSFDLIIEPSDLIKQDADELNALYEDCVTAIRESNPTRIIFIAPRKLSHPDKLCDLVIPSEANGYVMAEWHFYASGPDKANSNKLWTTGSDLEKALVTDQVEMAVNWQRQTGIYTWVGAWMPSNYNSGDSYTLEEQIVFSRFMCQVLSTYSIPFAINTDKFFYDYATDTWVDKFIPLMDVIFCKSM